MLVCSGSLRGLALSVTVDSAVDRLRSAPLCAAGALALRLAQLARTSAAWQPDRGARPGPGEPWSVPVSVAMRRPQTPLSRLMSRFPPALPPQFASAPCDLRYVCRTRSGREGKAVKPHL